MSPLKERNIVGTRVLVVDDQPYIRKLVRMTLSIGDFTVYEADNGMSALAMASNIKPKIILMDVMMPGEIDGLEACLRVKADPELADTAVIMVTARVQQADIEVGKAAGADAYLAKPFSPLQLIDTIDKLVAQSSRTS